MTSLPTKHVLPHTLAKSMLAACEDKARAMGLAMTIAIVDDGGHLIAFSRMDGVHAGTIELAIGKARSSVMFKRPTSKFEESVAAGTIGLLKLPNVLPFAGGVPLLVRSQLIGAVGVSGAAAVQDGQVASAALDLLPND
jgi:glc operon protein GlcG